MSALERMLGEFAAQRADSARASVLTAARLSAAEALRTHALPGRREENWRYTDLRLLERVPTFLPAAAMAADGALALTSALPAVLPGFARLVFIDGRLRPELSLPDALHLETLRNHAALAGANHTDPKSICFETSGDGRLGLLAGMFAPEPLSLRITGTMALEIISMVASAAYSDIELQLAAHAKLTLVERHLAAPAPVVAEAASGTTALGCARLRLILDADAQLVHTRLQQADAAALCYDTVTASLAERASYQLRHIAAGGGSARSTTQIRLRGRAATVRIRAAATAHAAQVADLSFTVLHEAPDTRSDQLFRGIASDQARVACSADVQVDPGAAGARVKQSLRGLIDGKGAEVDLRPRLTINTDDIQATHGATTGRLDDDLLFYLLSRGLSAAEARSLLKWAFLGEAFSAIEPAALRRDAELAAAGRLSDSPAAELLQ